MQKTVRPFWQEKTLAQMNEKEWEALCDGCALCCLHKLEDEDNGKIYYTRIACKLLDCQSGRCLDYLKRKAKVPACLKLNYRDLKQAQNWLPASCAYKRLYQGKSLPEWHPLITKDKNSVHTAKISVQSFAISENDIDGELEDYIYAAF